MEQSQPSQFTTKQFAGLMTGASVGALFEWYDWYLASLAAATVWPKIFFPTRFDPAAAMAISIATVGISYIAQPLGALLFGHIGDKFGRRNTLVWTLIVMGIASAGTALLPPYASGGLFSVAMVFVFRIVLGIGLGGESGGAISWIAEARPNAKHRGLWIGFPNSLLAIGNLLSILSFYLASSYMSASAYLDWGWRIPFAIGAGMVAVAVIIRVKVLESPMFQQLQAKRTVLKYPAFQVIKEQGRKMFTLLWLDSYIASIGPLIIIPYSISFLVKLGVSDTFASLSVAAGTASAFVAIVGGAFVSDYLGRIKVLRIGAILTTIMLIPYFLMLQTLIPVVIIAAQVLLYGFDEIPAGCTKAIYAESFPTKYRYSGSGLTWRFSSLATGITVSLVLPLLIMNFGIVEAWKPVVGVAMALVLVSILASFFVKETRGVALE